MEDAKLQKYTSEIYAKRFLDRGYDDSYVLWAERMVTSGFSSDHLFVLLGEHEPFNKFETDHLFDRIQIELNIPKVNSRQEAIEIEATALVRRFLLGANDKASSILQLAELYTTDEETKSLRNFDLLDHAHFYLENDCFAYSWPNADYGNIDYIFIEECHQWVNRYPLNEWEEIEPSPIDASKYMDRPTEEQLKPTEIEQPALIEKAPTSFLARALSIFRS
jgi:hypothetical protein